MCRASRQNSKQNKDIEKLRDDFPIFSYRESDQKPLVYLDNASSTQSPDCVINAVEQYMRSSHSNIHRGAHRLSQQATEYYENSRETVKSFLNAAYSHEIIFTSGTTDSINLVASSYGRSFLKEGDEIIVSMMEHHSNFLPWRALCEENKLKLQVVNVTENGELDIQHFKELLNEKTKFVALAHISNSIGTINPVENIISLAHEYNVPVLLDAAQSVSHLLIDVQQLDVDFFVFSGHKIFSPTGIGVLYAKEKWLEMMPPYQLGGGMVDRVNLENTRYTNLPYKFEAGTPHIAGAIGLAKSLSYLNEIDMDALLAHERKLLQDATDRISKIDRVRVIGQAAQKVSVLSFVVDGVHPSDIGQLLDQFGVAIRTGHHCTQPLMNFFGISGTARVSFSLYNRASDVDALVFALNEVLKILR